MSGSASSPSSDDLSLRLAAAVAQLCEKTIRGKVAEGELAAFRVGRRLAIPKSELDRFVQSRRVPVVPRGGR